MTHRTSSSARSSVLSAAVLAGLLVAAGSASAATGLVTNGSFEQGTAGIGSFGGWQSSLGDSSTFVDSNGQTGPHYGQAIDGLWSAFFGSTLASGGATISQALATTAGQSYLLEFDLADDNGGAPASNGFVVRLGGIAASTFTNLAAQDYVHRRIGFVAAGASTLLAFSAYNDSGWLELDNVVVGPAGAVAAVPEPTILGLLVPGLLMLGLRGRAAVQPRRAAA